MSKPIIKSDGYTITLVNRAEVLKALQPAIKKLLLWGMRQNKGKDEG